ncbi:putative NAD(P)-binding domain superfamily [Helianthus annuus]|nr:putative NAD(P)-binding domain superfamily [Helianthus annuus]
MASTWSDLTMKINLLRTKNNNDVMAMELGKYNISVNSICPGLFKSDITGELMQKKWLKNVASKVVPLRDFGTTDPALTSLIRYLIHN